MSADLQGVKNFREFAGEFAPGLLYRGGNLSCATPSDAQYFDRLAIKCVIDLRCGWERIEAPDAALSFAQNVHIPLYDAEIVGLEYTRPAPGTIQIGRDVACEPAHYYRSLANPKTSMQIAHAARMALDFAADGQGVYIHCSGGKDRAGIVAAVIMHVLGATRDQIVADYELTNISRDANTEEQLARFTAFAQGNVNLAKKLCDAHRATRKNLDYFAEGVQTLYGTFDAYINDVLGFDSTYTADIRRQCKRVSHGADVLTKHAQNPGFADVLAPAFVSVRA